MRLSLFVSGIISLTATVTLAANVPLVARTFDILPRGAVAMDHPDLFKRDDGGYEIRSSSGMQNPTLRADRTSQVYDPCMRETRAKIC